MFSLFTPSSPLYFNSSTYLMRMPFLLISHLKCYPKSGTPTPLQHTTRCLSKNEKKKKRSLNTIWISFVNHLQMHLSISDFIQQEQTIPECPLCVRHSARYLLQTWIRHSPCPSRTLQLHWTREASKQTDVLNFHNWGISSEHRQWVPWDIYEKIDINKVKVG